MLNVSKYLTNGGYKLHLIYIYNYTCSEILFSNIAGIVFHSYKKYVINEYIICQYDHPQCNFFYIILCVTYIIKYPTEVTKIICLHVFGINVMYFLWKNWPRRANYTLNCLEVSQQAGDILCEPLKDNVLSNEISTMIMVHVCVWDAVSVEVRQLKQRVF